MNIKQLHALIHSSNNLTDAAEQIGCTATNLREKLKSVGLTDYAKILNQGRGLNADRDRRIRDGFAGQTDWELYCYAQNCKKNRIQCGGSPDPRVMNAGSDTWVAQLDSSRSKSLRHKGLTGPKGEKK